MGTCHQCGAPAGWGNEICAECVRKPHHPAPDPAEAARLAERERVARLPITTTPTLPHHRIDETIDVVTAECVFGMNLFRDMFASFTDVFGGRSKASQKVLRDARRICLEELRIEADAIGGNAVIGVRLDYQEFSGGGKSMLFLVASGTAVRVSPEPGPPQPMVRVP